MSTSKYTLEFKNHFSDCQSIIQKLDSLMQSLCEDNMKAPAAANAFESLSTAYEEKFDHFFSAFEQLHIEMPGKAVLYPIEQELLSCWEMVDHLRFVAGKINKLTEDQISNIVLGLLELYRLKFETLEELISAL